LLLFLYDIYNIFWNFYNGGYERRGTIELLLNINVSSTIFLLIIIYNTKFTPQFIKKTITIIKLTVVIASIVSLIQVINISFMDAGPLWNKSIINNDNLNTLYELRRESIFSFVNPNELGLSYMPLLSVLIGVLIIQKSRYYIIFLILGGISAFLSNTRYVMIAFIFLTFQILIAQKRFLIGLTKYLITLLVSVLLLGFILTSLGYDIKDWYNSRLFAEGSISETTRYKAIDNFVIFFPKNPLFGVGGMTEEILEASNSIGSSQIHVGYLAHLVYFGIIGSFFLFGFWFLILLKLFRTARMTKYWGSFVAFFIFLWANATLVAFSLFFYGIIFAFVLDKYYLDNLMSHPLVEKRNRML
jgi:hypothetical protein